MHRRYLVRAGCKYVRVGREGNDKEQMLMHKGKGAPVQGYGASAVAELLVRSVSSAFNTRSVTTADERSLSLPGTLASLVLVSLSLLHLDIFLLSTPLAIRQHNSTSARACRVVKSEFTASTPNTINFKQLTNTPTNKFHLI